jgi:hypothetical protein
MQHRAQWLLDRMDRLFPDEPDNVEESEKEGK